MIDLSSLTLEAERDEHARAVLADYHEATAATHTAIAIDGGKGYGGQYKTQQARPEKYDLAELLRGPYASSFVSSRPDLRRLWRDDVPDRGMKLRKRIDKLTSKERDLMPAWVDRWTKIGLSTERADRDLFAAGVHACYRLSGHAPPARIVWVPCPLVLAYAGPIVRASVRASVDASVDDSVRASVEASVRASVDASVDDSVRASVDASVDDSVRASVEASVRASVDDSVRASVSDSMRDSVQSTRGKRIDCTRYYELMLGGQFWVGGWGWGNAYVSFMLDALGLDLGCEQELKARAYAATAMAACWWMPFEHVVLVSERPVLIEKNYDGSLRVARWEWTDANGEKQSWEVRP